MDMINPAFFAQFWYDELDYHFPLNDLQPVVRIPVAGPAPFNTLAVIRTIAPGSIAMPLGISGGTPLRYPPRSSCAATTRWDPSNNRCNTRVLPSCA